MEIRKVQVTGGSSYIISLPKTWIDSLNIKKNDPLGVIVQTDGTLLITPNINEEQTQRIIEFDIGRINEPTLLFRCLVGAYIAGYTIVKIRSEEVIPSYMRSTVRKFILMAIGQEVIEETSKSITIKDVLNPTEMPFRNTIRRMYIIAKNMHKDSINALKNRDKLLAEDVIVRDDEIDRLHWLLARQQNIVSKDIKIAQKMGVNKELVVNYFLIGRILERIGDHAVRIAENTLNIIDEKIDEEIIDALESASKFALKIFTSSIESFMEMDMKTANQNIESINKLVSSCERINNLVLQHRSKVAIPLGYIAESIRRTGEYASDLSESVINYIVETKRNYK